MKQTIFIFLVTLLYSCKNDSSEKKIFFSEYESIGLNFRKLEVLKIDSLFLYNNNPAYKIEFNSWLDMVINDVHSDYIPSLKGYIFLENRKVYFMPNIKDDTNVYFLFDFDMPIGNKYHYSSTSNELIYEIELENKFIDGNDTIYKLKYDNPSSEMHDLDLVFYIEKNKGVLGMYLSYFNEFNKEDEWYSYIGQICDFKKLKHFD